VNLSIVSVLIFIDSIVSAHRIYERRNACLLGSVIVSVEKLGLFAHRNNDLLSVRQGFLSVGKYRNNDRNNDLPLTPAHRNNSRNNDRVSKA
jgi:hypothetical protein